MKKDEWLVCLPVGKWQVSGIKKAKEYGLKILGIDADSKAEGKYFCDEFIIADIRNPNTILDMLLWKDIKLAGVLSLVSEAGMISAAYIREEFGLFGPNIEVTKKLTDKIEQRKAWQLNKIPIPNWFEFSSYEDAWDGVNKIGYPCVVKPSDSAGSRGVSIVEIQAEVYKAIEDALNFSISGKCLVEEYIHGIEYAIETFGCKGDHVSLCVTQKGKIPSTRGTVANELFTPDSPEISSDLGDLASKSLLALGYYDGPGHTEIIVTKEGRPYLVETAGRGGGFKLFESMVQKVSGFDIVGATIKQAIGQDFDCSINPQRKFATLSFIPSISGRINNITGIDEASRTPGVEVGLLVDIGTSMSEAKSDGDRVAYIISTAESSKESREVAKKAKELIKIHIEEP